MARTIRVAILWIRKGDTVISIASPQVVLELPGAKQAVATAGRNRIDGRSCSSHSALIGCSFRHTTTAR